MAGAEQSDRRDNEEDQDRENPVGAHHTSQPLAAAGLLGTALKSQLNVLIYENLLSYQHYAKF